MKRTRTRAMAVGAALLAMGLLAAPSVEITAVQQQYPWTNTVDITYEVRGVTNMEYFVRFTPTTSDDKEILDVNGEPSIQEALVSNGTFTAQWYPQTNLQYTACKMTPAIFRGGSGGGRDYLIIDLETWEVSYEPMATQEASNQRYNTTEYKTKKMVFRKIPADTYTIGHDDVARNQPHDVTFPADYYVAVFSLTQAQYQRLIENGDKTSTSAIPVTATWGSMRGNALIAARPSSGPLAKIQQRTGLNVDLGTHAMLEAAMRAKSRAKWVSGDSSGTLGNYIWYKPNAGGVVHPVGEKLPNAWGLYDVTGNEFYFTIESGSMDVSELEKKAKNGFTPYATTSSNFHLLMGGNYEYDADSGNIPFSGLDNSATARGYRFVIYPEGYYPNGGK